MDKPFSPACERNRGPILDVLRERFADCRHVLEIGSGTGQHAVHFAAAMPQLTWQTSDLAEHLPGIRRWLHEAGLPNTPPPWAVDVHHGLPAGSFDAVFTANTLHIMGWAEVQRFFEDVSTVMAPAALLTVYGPFKRGGRFSGEGDERFDLQLRQGHAGCAIRDLEAVCGLATVAGLQPLEDRAMPANNRCVTWRRG